MDGEPAVYLSDPVWREIAISIWDKDGDGFISEAEATEMRILSLADYDDAGNIEFLDLSALHTNICPYVVNLTRIKKITYGKSQYATEVAANSAKNNTSIEYVDTGDYYIGVSFGAFQGCSSLKSATLRASIGEIGQRAFQNCSSMESCYIMATIPPILGTWAFDGNPCNIYVPHASIDAYKVAAVWSQYASRIYGYDF